MTRYYGGAASENEALRMMLCNAERLRDEAHGRIQRALEALIFAENTEEVLRAKAALEGECIEECSSCGETFSASEQQAFDPKDNDHCPKCGERNCIVTLGEEPAT